MAQTPRTITVNLEAADPSLADLLRLVHAGAEVALTAQRLLELAPGDVSPVVFARQTLEPLQAAATAYLELAGDLIDVREEAGE